MIRVKTFLLIFFYFNANAQNNSIQLRGFFVNISGSVLFIRTEDTSNIFQSKNQQSLIIGGNEDSNDLLADATLTVGNRRVMKVTDGKSGKTFNMTVSYFYCNIELSFELNDQYDIGLKSTPQYFINYKYGNYPFGTIWIRNKVNKLKPKDEEVLLKLREYYTSRNYNVPPIFN